jgi:hypothetical protein
VNHHVKELEKVGLLEGAGERRKGNFVEQLYETAAGTFAIEATPTEAWHALEEVRAQRVEGTGDGEWWLPGLECRAIEIDSDAGRRLTVRSWAAEVGLEAGDLLSTVHGAPIYTSGDLGVIERVISSGDKVTASWIRAGDTIEASANI